MKASIQRGLVLAVIVLILSNQSLSIRYLGNKDVGQLGSGYKQTQNDDNGYREAFVNTILEEENLASIATTKTGVVAVTWDNGIVLWGFDFQLMGLGEAYKNLFKYPHYLELEERIYNSKRDLAVDGGFEGEALKVVCGDFHCHVLANSPGEIWSWGSMIDGQVGLGLSSNDRLDFPVPRRFKEPVVDMAACGRYSLFLGISGNAYEFGRSYYGNKETWIKNFPSQINKTDFPYISRGSIAECSVVEGVSHIILVRSEGYLLYFWGKLMTHLTSDYHTAKPKLIASRVLHICAGRNYMAFTTMYDSYIRYIGESITHEGIFYNPILIPAPDNTRILELKCGNRFISITDSRRDILYKLVNIPEDSHGLLRNPEWQQWGHKVDSLHIATTDSRDDDEVLFALSQEKHILFRGKNKRLFFGPDANVEYKDFESPGRQLILNETMVQMAQRKCDKTIIGLTDKGQIFGWAGNEHSGIPYLLHSRQEYKYDRMIQNEQGIHYIWRETEEDGGHLSVQSDFCFGKLKINIPIKTISRADLSIELLDLQTVTINGEVWQWILLSDQTLRVYKDTELRKVFDGVRAITHVLEGSHGAENYIIFIQDGMLMAYTADLKRFTEYESVSKAVCVAGGKQHALILTEENKIYAYGCPRWGNMGKWTVNSTNAPPLDEKEKCFTGLVEIELPQKVNRDIPIIKIEVNEYDNYLLFEDGSVVNFGYGASNFENRRTSAKSIDRIRGFYYDEPENITDPKVLTAMVSQGIPPFSNLFAIEEGIFFFEPTMCGGYHHADYRACSRKGWCRLQDQCLCYAGYSGSNCESKIPPKKKDTHPPLQTGIIVVTVVTVFLLLTGCLMLGFFCVICCSWCRYRSLKKNFKTKSEKLSLLENRFQIELLQDGSGISSKDNELAKIPFEDLEFQEIIGSGGSGAKIVKAKWNLAFVAVKVFPKISQDAVDEFYSEATFISSLLSHPNVIQCYGIAEDDNRLAMVQEFCPHGSMKDWIGKGLDLVTKVHWLLQLTDSVAYLHSHSVVHRDLKLENVLLDEAKRPKIIDFGLSKKQDQRMTKNLGTSHYCAPELILGEENYTNSADIFSLSMIFYEVLLDTLKPFGEHHQTLFIEMKIAQDPDFRPSLKKLGDLEEEWGPIIASMWDQNPDVRPTARELARWLEKKKSHLEKKARGSTTDLLLPEEEEIQEKDKIDGEAEGGTIEEAAGDAIHSDTPQESKDSKKDSLTQPLLFKQEEEEEAISMDSDDIL